MPTVLGKKLSILLLFLIGINYAALAQPKADFAISNTSGCSPLTVNFTNKTTGGSGTLKFTWRLGNSNISHLVDASAIYYLPKVYSITLIATDNGGSGKTDSVTKSVTVYGSPTALFKSDAAGGCPPFNINFTDLSSTGSSAIVSWLWDFGDGSTSTSQNPPTHQYTGTGKFTVSLQVKDKNGCSNAANKQDFIVASIPPTIDFTASPPGGCTAPVTASFTPKITSSGTGFTYSWDFGDGNTSTSASPSNTYSAEGSYTVKLKCTDNTGCSGSKTKADFVFIGKPTADFKFNPGQGCSPLNVSFNDNSTGGAGGSYYWDFGDGTSSTNQYPSHNYSVGTYSVKFVVKSASGCKDSVTKQNIITVTKGFTPSFSVDSVLCQLPFSTNFSNTSGANTTVVAWDFGDKKKYTGENISHTYPDTGGFYSVTLTVSDGNGCVQNITKKNIINAKQITARIGYAKSEGCAPFDFIFTNNSFCIDPIVSTLWNFGDLTTSTVYDPASHNYSDTGSYIVTLKVVSKKGCKAIATVGVNAGTRPHASFIAYPTTGCLNKLRHVHFTNTTNVNATIKADKYQWDFGDGTVSSDISPVHRYMSKPGKYDVRLIAFNKGCSDTLLKSQFITILGPWARYAIKRDGCVANIVSFFDSSIGANHVKYIFGDGDSSTQRNPVHTYTAGEYHPFQIVYNDTTGCTDTFTLFPPGSGLIIRSPWVVTLSTPTVSGCLPLTVFFTVNNNDSADNVIYFGNGDSAIVSSSNDPSQIVSYTYTQTGTYTVKMKAVNKSGCNIVINLPHTVVANGPFVDFGIDKIKGCVPLTVTLTDKSTIGNTISKKVYDMGNGDIMNVTAGIMSYTYTSPPPNQYGGFSITERVTDVSGCTSEVSKLVYPSKVAAVFNIDSNVTCKNVIYSFSPADIGLGPFKYAWNLGNGATSNTRSPVIVYPNGSYRISLKITDDNGCTDTASKKIAVKKYKSHADFSIDSTVGACPPFHAIFHDHSRFAFGGHKGYEWDFGDGSYHSTNSDPEKVYYNAGKFTVKLKITDSIGCMDSIVKVGLIVVKGAIGDYNFDKRRGCTPLSVHFTAKSKNASKFAWDLGDGSLGLGDTLTHVYNDTRHYVPLLILSDSAGCTYTLPPKDTIIVDKLPTPDFTFDSICSGLPTYFIDKSDPGSGVDAKWAWDFGDGGKATGSNPSHIFRKNGFYTVTFTVTNSFGCAKTTSKKIKIGGITAAFSSSRTGCVGTPVVFADKSVSDTLIRSWTWLFGDGSSSTLQNPTHTFFKKGRYPVSLFVANERGCVDTVIKGGYLVIGDTVPPPPPTLYRVTVVDDNTVEIDFSKYKDVDFDHYFIYMADKSGNYIIIDRIDDINDTVHTIQNLNTLHNAYCFKVQVYNACGFYSTLSPQHCTMDVTAKPGIDQAFVSWTPYTGWNKIKIYQIYRKNFYNSAQYLLIDSVTGDITSYTDTNVICFRPATYHILAIEDSGYRQVSWSDTSTTLPIHENHVPAPDMIHATVPDNKRVQIEWKDFPKLKVKKWMVEKSTDGMTYQQLDTPYNRNVLSVFDKHVDVHKTSYYYRLKMMDSCGDIGPYSYIGKTIVAHADTTPEAKPFVHWSPYKDWPEGVKYYDIEIKDQYGNYRFLAQTPTGNDTDYIDNITDLNSLPDYCYRVVAHRNGPAANPDQNVSVTSMSNEACMRVVSRVFVPNAFTPNGDGTNDSFRVKGLYIRDYHIKIYDRWGTRIFESSSLNDNWDGTYKHGKPLMDSYKYIIYVRGVDNKTYFLDGWVTILP
jgi:gliding motility-associated-like protein